MSRLKRQRESLLSGFDRQVLAVPAVNTPLVVQLPVPIGNPMDIAGTQRNAPMPFLSLWVGFRPETDFAMGGGSVTSFFEAGIIPYGKQPDEPVARAVRPLFVPLNGTSAGPFMDTLGMASLLPWPAGKLLVRMSLEFSGPNPFGAFIDATVAWTVNSQSAYGNLPAIQDLVDL